MKTRLIAFLVLTPSFLLDARGDSASWNLNPTSGDWNTSTNWTPATVPNGPADTATFDFSNLSAIALSTSVEVSGITFDVGASAFSLTVPDTQTLTISGPG